MNGSIPEMLARAATHVDAGELEQAEAICCKLLALDPRNPHALHVRGVAARKQARHERAAELFRQSLAIEPHNFAVEFELGVVHIEQKQWSEALAHFQRALKLNPDYQAACVNIGTLLERLDRVEEALPWAERAVRMDPTCATAYFNLANLLQAVGRVKEAICAFDEALRLKPDHANARWNGSLAHLLAGDFASGWQMYEARIAAGKVTIDRYPQPRWQGESLAGKTILIHAEQGIGDEILFASCLPDLLAQGGKVVVVCDPRLEHLFARSFPNVRVYGIARRKDTAPAEVPERIDYQLPLGSLPGFYRNTRESFPRRWRLLQADPTQREVWRGRFDELGPGLKVGISWRAGGQPLERRKRTTTLDQWLPILVQRGVRFINMQYGEVSDELAAAKRDWGITIHDFAEGDPLVDLDAFAARLSALDLVISVGNATVHLAGALGVPAWSLLPLVPAWRWMLAGEQSLWYPSVRLFRQTQRGHWTPVFEAVATALASRMGRVRQPSEATVAAPSQPPQLAAASEQDRQLLTLADVTDRFALAAEAFQNQDYTAAESICMQILAHAPRDAKALHLRGLIAQATGRLELAIKSLDLATQVSPQDASLQQHLASMLAQAGRQPAVTAGEQRAKRLVQNPSAAAESTAPLVAKAADLYNKGRLDEAVAIAERLLALDEHDTTALRILGVAARKAGNPQRSLELIEQALAQKPDDYALRFEYGVTLAGLHRSREALAQFERVVQLRPSFPSAYVNIGAIYEEQERYEDVVGWARKSLELKPNCELSYYNLANALRELGRLDEAIAAYHRTLELKPGYEKAEWNLGISYLLVGNYQQGWPLFERRITLGEVAVDDYPQPRWDGSSLAGKSILIHAEQGIGDEVLFASCFAEVIAQARQCTIVCEPRLETLFRRSFPQAIVYGYQRRKDRVGMKLSEAIDVQIPAGSLPLLLRQRAEAFPRQKSLLEVDERALQFWRKRLNALGPGLKVGISWRAGGKPQERRKRMIPLDLWSDVLTTPGVQFVNLQYSDSSEDVAQIGRELGITIHDWEDGDPLVDLDGFAAKIKALDLVISVGNTTVHVAGAVGTEAWTLLPKVPSWRWMVRGEQSPWYTTVSLFRQTRRDDWSDVMETISRRLRTRVGAEMTPPRTTARIKHESTGEHWLQADEVSADAMLQSIGRSLSEGDRCLAASDFDSAEAHYRDVLQIAPRHFQALHGLGVVARLTGRSELAIRSFQRSLAMVEGVAAHQSNYAGALADAGRLDEALAAYGRALELDPALSVARLEMGRVLQRLGEHQRALALFDQASLTGAEDAQLLVCRGISHASQCRIEKAIECFEQALRLDPSHLQALAALADVYVEDQQYEDAERCLRRAIAQRHDVPTWHLMLGRVLRQQGELGAAIGSLETAAELACEDMALQAELAALYRETGEPERAVEILRQAAALQPDNPDLQIALGISLAEDGKPGEAIRCYDRALATRPDDLPAHESRAFALLAQGNFAAGWRDYTWRASGQQASRLRGSQAPVWQGEALQGRSILVYGQGSMEEEILFASCYRDLIERATEVAIVCQPRLEQLIRRSFPRAMVFPVTRGQEFAWCAPTELRCDYQIAAGSLPALLRGTRQQFPGDRYLEAQEAKVASWRTRFAALGDVLKVGIAWRAGGTPAERFRRGDSLDTWLPLLNTQGVQFVNLQSGDVREELQEFALKTGIVVHHWNDADNSADLEGLAARMAALDLVISVGSTTARLAGSLGAPTWALLPRVAGWQWLAVGEEDDRCLWHHSVQLFRQCRLGEWGDLFARLKTDLLNRVRSKDEEPSRGNVGIPLGIGTGGNWLPLGAVPIKPCQ